MMRVSDFTSERCGDHPLVGSDVAYPTPPKWINPRQLKIKMQHNCQSAQVRSRPDWRSVVSEIQVGRVKVLLGAGTSQREVSRVFGSEMFEGDVVHGMIVGPGGLQLDVRYFMADTGEGLVGCTARGDSDEAFERLIRGARPGVYREDSGDYVLKQLRLLRWDPTKGWGNPTKTDIDELDALAGSSVKDLFESIGVLELGTKAEVLGGSGNDLALRWSEDAGAAPAFAAYALTRVLPIVHALDHSDD